ncbi:MerR family DNA-binding transcriptional regulator [Paenalkalicoccus suaedae]|uniref:MerR family DNA-binding transcriptional regulator n=1 Tax=Paenalkalicoccus suaedae TaxID=2592382 RepID=A0A859FB67_9BACI|nr:MerR family DNA-binding transcriptional regulator [Paenalkalicoccus suaedae]QKS69901.1 MerR family DNA-binding transcriptional regulator [Paenalkalicoccus suaedae]
MHDSHTTYYSIGEVAKKKHVTIKALRYYHKVGILVPEHIDPENGYRYYTPHQLLHVDIIKVARFCQASIKELQLLFSTGDTKELYGYLTSKKQELTEQMQQLQDVSDVLDSLKDYAEESERAKVLNKLEQQEYEDRLLVVSPIDPKLGLEDFAEHDDLEAIIESLNVLPTYRTGYILTDLHTSHVFHVIRTKHRMPKDERIHRLPAGSYLTISYRYGQKQEAIRSIQAYADKEGIEVTVMYEFELLSELFEPGGFIHQIQVRLSGPK